jgi:hypothetical protein
MGFLRRLLGGEHPDPNSDIDRLIITTLDPAPPDKTAPQTRLVPQERPGPARSVSARPAPARPAPERHATRPTREPPKIDLSRAPRDPAPPALPSESANATAAVPERTAAGTEAPAGKRRVAREAGATCPYCALLLVPPPERGRLCPRCRRPIVVRRVDGRQVLLTKEAVEVFEAERLRESNERNWASERRRWLALARGVAAPVGKVSRLGAGPPSSSSVASARDLYLASAEKALRVARRAKRWSEVARIRRDQAAALYRESGAPVPPADTIVALHREWSVGALRAAAAVGADAELVSGGCCRVCDKDDGRAYRITTELRAQRLPHEGCPKGLCGCDWYPLPDSKTPGGRKKRRASARPVASAQTSPVEVSAQSPEVFVPEEASLARRPSRT